MLDDITDLEAALDTMLIDKEAEACGVNGMR